MLRFLLRFLIFAALTLITQIGGLAYLLALAIGRASGIRSRLLGLCLFVACYAAATVAATVAAPVFGRVPLSCFAGTADSLAVRSPLYCALNRNYVTPQMRELANALVAGRIVADDTSLRYIRIKRREAFMKSFAFSDLNRQSGEVLDAALAAPVTLTKHGKPKLVLMRADDYERLTATRAYSIYDAPDHIIAELQAGLDDILAEKS